MRIMPGTINQHHFCTDPGGECARFGFRISEVRIPASQHNPFAALAARNAPRQRRIDTAAVAPEGYCCNEETYATLGTVASTGQPSSKKRSRTAMTSAITWLYPGFISTLPRRYRGYIA